MTKLEQLALAHGCQCCVKGSVVDPDVTNEESFVAGFKAAREMARQICIENDEKMLAVVVHGLGDDLVND